MTKIRLLATCLSCLLTLTSPTYANEMSSVSVNGITLNVTQLRSLERHLGGRIAPGPYLLNAAGCWLNLQSGASGCLNGVGDRHSRYGSGSRDANGNWNHWSDAAGGAVGGTADGCIYTSFGWSNC